MNEILLSKVRLEIIAQLLTAEWLSLSQLRESMDVTNGNLGSHLGNWLTPNTSPSRSDSRDGARRVDTD